MSAPVSVLVPTLDEELNLAECLRSVAWADEVFVVDSFSSDRTVEIARQHGAQVVQHAFESYSRQKNWALDTLPWRNDWVLIVDADERVSPALRQEIERLLGLTHREAPAPPCTGYYVNRKFIFLGHWIRHAGWYPSWNLRFFRHQLGRYDGREVHEHVVLRGSVGYLQSDLIHQDRRGLEAFVARHNRYSTLEAAARFKAEHQVSASRAHEPDSQAHELGAALGRGRLPVSLLASPVQRKRFLRERIWPKVPAKPLALFIYMFILRRGFLDGRPGLALCVFHAFQEFTVNLKLAELRRLSS